MAEGGVSLGSAYGSVEIGTDQATANIKSLAGAMRSAGTAMSLGVTAPLAGIAAAAVNSAGQFEQSLNVMGQVTGATADQMATLQAQALQLGAVTSFSAGEAAEAMLELGKAGLAPAEIGDAIAGTMDLAAAGNLGLAQAATIAANAMNAFQLPASEVTNIANTLAAAANASSVDVTDLAAGMQMAGAVFASNGQSVEDLTTALAILGNNAITGSDAGTSLKTMLLRLASPTDDAAAAMEALGLEVFNADGSMRGFQDIVGNLQQATTGLTDQQRSMALTTIFGADAIRAATILAREGADGFADMGKAVGKQGAAAATANARMKGMSGAIEYLKGSIDSFLIVAALPFLDSFSGVVRVVADGITAIGALPEPVRNAALAFAAALAAAGPLMLAISGVTAAAGFLLSPVGLLVAGVAALAAGFVLWQSNFGGIQQRAAQFAGTLKEMAEAATGADLDAVADGLRSFGRYLAETTAGGDYLNDWLTHLPEAAQPAALAIGQFVAAVGGLAQTGDFDAFVASIQAIDWGGLLAQAVEGLSGLKDGMVAAIQGIDWAGALATAGDWLDGLKNGVVVAIQGIPWGEALTAAGSFLDALEDGAVGALQSIPWADALATVGGWLDGFKGGVIAAVQSIDWAGALAQAGDYLASLWGNAVGALGRIDWAGALATAAGWLDTLKANVVAAIQAIDWSGALATAGNAFAGLEAAVGGGLQALGFTGAADSLDGLKAALGGLPETINGAKAAFSGLLMQVAPIAATIAAFFAPAVERLQTAFTALPEKLAPLMPKLEALGGAIGGLMTALQPFALLFGGVLAVAVELTINRLTTVFGTLPAVLGVIIEQATATINLISAAVTAVVAVVSAIFTGDWAAAWESAKALVSEFNTFFRGLFSRLGTFMGAVARNISEPIIQTLKTLGIDITPILNAIQKTFEDIWGKIQTAIQGVIDIVGAATDKIGEFKDFLSGLNLPNPFQPLVDAWNVVQGGISSLTGGDGTAGGTSYFRGGATAINERGYEQVILPAGSRVLTNGQTNNLPDQEGTVININLGGVTAAGDMDARRLGNLLRDQLAVLGV